MPTPQLGVLFVHGIGQQAAGQTLVEYADPLSRWLTRWLTKGERTEAGVGSPDGVRVRLGDTNLGEGEEPAHLTMTVEFAPDIPAEEEHRWLLAESWWAETFRPASARSLLLWMLLILPYMVLMQFNAMLRRAWRPSQGWHNRFVRPIRIAAFFVVYVSSFPLAALGGVVIAVMLIGILVPIPQISERAKKAALVLSSTVGDSFVLVHSAVQFDAMVTRVARDLAWLSKRATNVIVVAHSQGTAVAYHAIRGYEFPKNLRAFVTIGEGLKKLSIVRALETYGDERETVPRLQRPSVPKSMAKFRGDLTLGGDRLSRAVKRTLRRWFKLRSLRFTFAWAGLLGAYVVAYAGLWLVFGFGHNSVHTVRWAIVGGVGLGVAIFVSVIGYVYWQKDLDLEPDPLRRSANDKILRWANFYASADPVPNGPLFRGTDAPEWLREQEVWNYASVLRDHTTYAASEDDFLSSLVEETLMATDLKFPVEAENQLERARWRGWWRVWWLTVARALTAVAAVATVYRVWGHIPAIGARVIKWGHWEPAHSLGKAVVRAIQKVLLLGQLSDQRLVGGLTVLAVLGGGYALISVVWSYWQRQDIKRFYRRMTPETDTDPLGGREFLWFLESLILLAVVAVTVGITGDYAVAWDWATGHFEWSVGIVFLLALAPVALMWPLRRPMRRREERLIEKFRRGGKPERIDAKPAPTV